MSFSKPKKEKHLSQRVDKELHYKLHYISKYYGRSANGEVIYLIRKAIEAFEAEHGKIEPPAGLLLRVQAFEGLPSISILSSMASSAFRSS